MKNEKKKFSGVKTERSYFTVNSFLFCMKKGHLVGLCVCVCVCVCMCVCVLLRKVVKTLANTYSLRCTCHYKILYHLRSRKCTLDSFVKNILFHKNIAHKKPSTQGKIFNKIHWFHQNLLEIWYVFAGFTDPQVYSGSQTILSALWNARFSSHYTQRWHYYLNFKINLLKRAYFLPFKY